MNTLNTSWEIIIGSAGCPVVVTDALAKDNPIVFVNARFEELSGYKKEEIIGRNPRILHGNEGDQPGLKVLRQAISEKRPCKTSIRDYRKDGAPFWVEAAISPIFDHVGALTHYIGIQHDISQIVEESGRREEFINELSREVVQQETRSRVIIEQAFDAFVGLNPQGRVVDWNSSAEFLFGRTRQKALGQDFVELFIPESARQYFRTRWLCHDSGRDLGGERCELIMINGTELEIPVEMVIFPIETHQERHFCAFIQDISVRKDAEQRIREFYALLSHELRSPLTSIRGALGLIEGGIVGDIPMEAAEMVTVARESSERLMALVDDILDLKKIEAGKFDLDIKETDIALLLKEAAQGLNGMAEQFKVRIETVLPPVRASVKADHRRLIQVLINLISNGLKYSPEGGVLTVKLSDRDKYWRIEVKDQGPGIAAENLPKLFDKFKKLESSDGKERKGTGLGLAISKALVEQHQGRIGVDSKLAEGSTFWFEIPQDAAVCVQTSPDNKVRSH